jgi:hypothetical protein
MAQEVSGLMSGAGDRMPDAISDGFLTRARPQYGGNGVHKNWQDRRLCFPILPQVINNMPSSHSLSSLAHPTARFLGHRVLSGKNACGA